MAFTQSQSRFKISLADQMVAGTKSLTAKFRKYQLYKKTVSELSCLSARELSDLGLSRSMIKNVAVIAVYENKDFRKELQ